MAEPGDKVLAYKAYGGKIEDRDEVIKLGDILKTKLNLHNNPTVATPVPATKNKKHLPPLCALIGRIPPQKAHFLLNMKFLSTPNLTVFFIPFNPEPTTFVTTLKGFIFPKETKKETEEQVRDIVNNALFFGDNKSTTTTATKRMLANHRDRIPAPLNVNVQEAARYLAASTTVRRLDLVRKEDIGTGEGKGDPAWNVYIAPPTSNFPILLEWIALIRATKFVTIKNNAGTARKPFTCTVCHSEDHPGGMCNFPAQPDWITPPPTDSPALSNLLSTTQPTAVTQNPPTRRGGNRGGPRSRGTTTRGRGSTRA